MKLIFKLSTLFFLLFGFSKVNAQSHGITEIHRFMQLNADTTLIFEIETGWLEPPHYRIISKKGDTITAYTYQVFPQSKIEMPKAIYKTLQKTYGFIPPLKIGIDQNFRPFPMRSKYKGKIWKILTEDKPWEIADDSVDGKGCPAGTINQIIFDAGTLKLSLITSKEIKVLSFYAPDFYEELCPGRKGRQFILKIKDYFDDFFRIDY